jgi:2Fe-2S ferredoxin
MPQITFIQLDGREIVIDAQSGLSVMEIAVKHSQDKIEGSCGGSLACATCHLYVHPDWWDKVMPEDGEISDEENDMLDLAFHLTKRSRLSCQIIMRDDLDGLIVALPGSKVEWAGQ